MREKETYRDNLEYISGYFGGKRILTIPEVAKFVGTTANVLSKDERFRSYTFDYGKQRRISTASLARWMTT